MTIQKRVFIVYVEDKPGVLNRVASLFRRRSYNIDSLSVGHTDQVGVSRMTIVMEADDTVARLVEANLYKLVNVLHVKDVTWCPSVSRDLALIKVRATAQQRAEDRDLQPPASKSPSRHQVTAARRRRQRDPRLRVVNTL